MNMDTIIYQEIAELQKKVAIIHKSFFDTNEASKIKDLWEEVRAIETEIDHLYDSIEVH